MTDWTALARAMRQVREAGIAREVADEVGGVSAAHQDQFDAATRDTTSRRESVELMLKAKMGDRFSASDRHDTPVEMRDVLDGMALQLLAGLLDGTTSHCPHVSLDAPVPWIGVVWLRRISCSTCAAVTPLSPVSEVEDHTCDMCGRYTPNQRMDAINGQFGPMETLFGVCQACGHRITPKEETPSQPGGADDGHA